tara:strand:+ start:124 stop:561 length:438 start_codon:yes stop_codon:yes gene_type:complete
MHLEDIVVEKDQNVKARLYIENLYPRDQNSWEWLRGGDLLYASGILFSLINVQYMSVFEGPDLRRTVEEKARVEKNMPNYFYYNKYILGPARSVVEDASFESYKLNQYDQYEDVLTRYLYNPDRRVDSTMESWLWEKKEDALKIE